MLDLYLMSSTDRVMNAEYTNHRHLPGHLHHLYLYTCLCRLPVHHYHHLRHSLAYLDIFGDFALSLKEEMEWDIILTLIAYYNAIVQSILWPRLDSSLQASQQISHAVRTSPGPQLWWVETIALLDFLCHQCTLGGDAQSKTVRMGC